MKHDYAEVNGIRLHYVHARPQTEAKPKLIVFVHGFPEFWYAWKDQLVEFGKDYLAVAPDLRGYNLSDKPADVKQYRAKILIEDIRQLIEHLGYRSCVLVAHDWGGALAWAFAAWQPQYVEKLVIINSPHPALFARELTHNPAQQQASAYMNFFRTSKAEAKLAADNYAVLSKVIGWGQQWDAFTEEDRAAYLAAWSQPGALTGGLNFYRASPLHPPTPDDPGAANVTFDPATVTIRVPTLVIWGERDIALLPGLLDGLDEYIPDLTVKRVPDGSHWIVHEKPELVNRTIRDFIERTATQVS